MSIDRRLLAIIGRRLPSIYDVIPRGHRVASRQTVSRRLRSTLNPSRPTSWAPPSLPSSSIPPGLPIASASIRGSRSATSMTGVPLDRRS